MTGLLPYFVAVLFLLSICFQHICCASTHDDGLLVQYAPVSYKQCRDKCNVRLKCVSVKYFRRYHHCKLYSVHQEVNVGFDVYSKPEVLIQEQSERLSTNCGEGSWDVLSTCVPVSCSAPPYVFGTDVLGNIYKIGSKVKYRCKSTIDTEVSTCTSDGTWTNVNLVCYCKASAQFDFTVIRRNETHIITERSCGSGSAVVQNEYMTCDLSSGVWVTPVSCCETEPKPWEQIFEYFSGVGGVGPLHVWKNPLVANTSYYSRSSIIYNWNEFNITRVKLEVFKDGIVEAFLVFNGCGSTKRNWFSPKRLLSSSWDDLQYGSELDKLSILGEGLGYRRFYVSKSYGDIDSCTTDIGWFVTTGSYYLCNGVTKTPIVVLYSPNETAIRFYEMDHADKFVISIKREN